MPPTRIKKMGVREFVFFARKEYGVKPPVTRAVMLAWRDWMTTNLTAGLHVYQEHVGTYKLTKRKGGRTIVVPCRGGTTRTVTQSAVHFYVTFKASTKLKKIIREKHNPKV